MIKNYLITINHPSEDKFIQEFIDNTDIKITYRYPSIDNILKIQCTEKLNGMCGLQEHLWKDRSPKCEYHGPDKR